MALTGRELVNARQLKETTDYRIRMRQVVPISALKHRLVYRGTMLLYPDSVIRIGGRNEFFEILATWQQGETP